MLHALILGFRQLADPSAQRLLVRCVLLAIATFVLLLDRGGDAARRARPDRAGVARRRRSRSPAPPPCWCWPGCCSRSSIAIGARLLRRRRGRGGRAAPLSRPAAAVGHGRERQRLGGAPVRRGRAAAQPAGAAARTWCPGANLLIYLALNGYLLGREYFETVAARRLPGAHGRPRCAAGCAARLWLAGVVIAALLAVPVFNLVAPVVAIAFMVHLLRRVAPRARHRAEAAARCRRSGRVAGARVGATEMFDFARSCR